MICIRWNIQRTPYDATKIRNAQISITNINLSPTDKCFNIFVLFILLERPLSTLLQIHYNIVKTLVAWSGRSTPSCQDDKDVMIMEQDSKDVQGQKSAVLLHSICQLLTRPGDYLFWCTADQNRTMAPVTSLEKRLELYLTWLRSKRTHNMHVCACVPMQTNKDIYNWQAAFHCLFKCWFLFYWESILAASFSFPVEKTQTVALNLMENMKINYTE